MPNLTLDSLQATIRDDVARALAEDVGTGRLHHGRRAGHTRDREPVAQGLAEDHHVREFDDVREFTHRAEEHEGLADESPFFNHNLGLAWGKKLTLKSPLSGGYQTFALFLGFDHQLSLAQGYIITTVANFS